MANNLYYCIVLLVLFLTSIANGQWTNCTLPSYNATSIYDLRPSDIKVIMSLGDSITAGYGIASGVESRGASFSVGGDEGAVTLANFIQVFNPDVIGASAGSHVATVCYGSKCPTLQYYPTIDVFNAAQSGASTVDIASRGINYLVRQLNNNPYVNVQQDWKVLTIFVGMNDLCASCTFGTPYLDPSDYESTLMSTLERVRRSLPRTMVNIVAGYNVSQVYDMSLNADFCANTTRTSFIGCDCIYKPEAQDLRNEMDALITEYNLRAAKVASYYYTRQYTDFAVVVQPFFTEMNMADLPSSFLSDVDCFHPSQKGHEAMAVALWNSMLTPAAFKKTTFAMDDAPLCPSEDTLIYTY